MTQPILLPRKDFLTGLVDAPCSGEMFRKEPEARNELVS